MLSGNLEEANHGVCRILIPLILSILTLLSACGGGSGSSGDDGGSYRISGTVYGTNGGGLVLSLNGGETLEVGGVSFSFNSQVASGRDYRIIVSDSPAGHHCDVKNGRGTVAGNDVTDVEVVCRRWREAQKVPGAGNADSSVGGAGWRSGGIYPAVDDDGNAVVLWWQNGGPVQAGRHVVGSGWDTPVMLGDNAFNGVLRPDNPVVMDSQGNATLFWRESEGPGSFNMLTRRYRNGAGWEETERLPVPPEGEVGLVHGGGYPGAAVDASGNVMGIWHAWDGSARWARFDVSSGTWMTDVFSLMTVGQAFLFDLVADNSQSGAFMMVWAEQNALYSRRYTPVTGWGMRTLVADSAGLLSMGAIPGEQPTLAMDEQGNGIVAWIRQDDLGSTGQGGLWVSHYSPGTGWGEAQRPGPDVDSRAVDPRVVMDDSGRAVLIWRVEDHLWAAGYDPDSGGWGEAEQVAATVTGADLALDGAGRALVLFTSGPAVLSLTFDHQSGPGETVMIHDAGDDSGVHHGAPAISSGTDGSAFATWLRRLPDDDSDDVEYWFSRLDPPSAFLAASDGSAL